MLERNKCVLVNRHVYLYKWRCNSVNCIIAVHMKMHGVYQNVCTLIIVYIGMQGDTERLAYCHAYEYTLL